MRRPARLPCCAIAAMLAAAFVPAPAGRAATPSFRESFAARPELWTTPATWPADHPLQEGLRSIYYEGVPYHGHETRVFAYVGMPDAHWPRPVPAMVLVHGGGGTAFAEFVRAWTARGYAAIAMDLEGHLPIRVSPRSPGQTWEPHDWPGPSRPGIFEDASEPFEDQWIYHVVVAITRAHTLIAADPEVDPRRIGLCGFSWGGIHNVIVGGIDHRFRFVIPIYGSGFLDETEGNFGEAIRARPAAERAFIRTRLDPSAYAPGLRAPSLWLIGTNDNFQLDTWQRTWSEAAGPVLTAVVPGLRHGSRPAWERPESYAFADMITRGTLTLPAWSEPRVAGGRLQADLRSSTTVRVELVWTADTDTWKERTWQQAPLAATGSGPVSATLPPAAAAAFLNAIREDGCVVSTRIMFMDP